MADQQQLMQARMVFDTLCQMLDEDDWHYEKDSENEFELHCGARGDDLPIGLKIVVDPDRRLIVLLSPMMFAVPEDKRIPMAVAVSYANYGLVDGNFDYDFINGQIAFRMTSSFYDSLIGKELFKYMLYVACNTVDNYNDKFLALTKLDIPLEKIGEFVEGKQEA